MTYVTKDWDFWELLWPQIFRGIGLMFSIVPVTNTALGTLAPERVKNASGLFNLTRNLGGAIGLAAINTVLNDRMDLHLARLHEAVNWAREPATETLARLTSHFQGSDAQLDGAQADDGHGTTAGGGDELCRRLPDLDRAVRRPGRVRRHHAAAGAVAAGADGH